ncbi:MAG: putative metal-dependent hydrolase [Flavobacteriales bacterium]|nr:putative metal-dependent hydrolase [Flavobacteriales bacterium]
MKDIETLRFPVGRFQMPGVLSSEQRKQMTETIRAFPEKLEAMVSGLSEELDWRYRPEGWMIRQVVHHCADSHMNALIRFKLTLTEDSPTIRPYFEDRWAELTDTLDAPIRESLDILKGVHSRWSRLLGGMSDSDFAKHYVHPEYQNTYTLDQALANYDWHCKHHAAHIQQALEHKGEFNT